jgi:hypothetical protein
MLRKTVSLGVLAILLIANFSAFSQATPKGNRAAKPKAEPVQEEPKSNAAEIEFVKTVHDYGTIYKNDDGVCYFEFRNIGKADLLLTNVSSSCGCTVPQWPKEPIAPGQSEKIKVSYNTSRIGGINKNVFVDWNGGERVTLNIKGNVIEQPKEILPENKTSPIMNND